MAFLARTAGSGRLAGGPEPALRTGLGPLTFGPSKAGTLIRQSRITVSSKPRVASTDDLLGRKAIPPIQSSDAGSRSTERTFLVAQCHSLTVSSFDFEAIRWPSWEKPSAPTSAS